MSGRTTVTGLSIIYARTTYLADRMIGHHFRHGGQTGPSCLIGCHRARGVYIARSGFKNKATTKVRNQLRAAVDSVDGSGHELFSSPN